MAKNADFFNDQILIMDRDRFKFIVLFYDMLVTKMCSKGINY